MRAYFLVFCLIVIQACGTLSRQNDPDKNTPAVYICKGVEYHYLVSWTDFETINLHLNPKYHSEATVNFESKDCVQKK